MVVPQGTAHDLASNSKVNLSRTKVTIKLSIWSIKDLAVAQLISTLPKIKKPEAAQPSLKSETITFRRVSEGKNRMRESKQEHSATRETTNEASPSGKLLLNARMSEDGKGSQLRSPIMSQNSSLSSH